MCGSANSSCYWGGINSGVEGKMNVSPPHINDIGSIKAGPAECVPASDSGLCACVSSVRAKERARASLGE